MAEVTPIRPDVKQPDKPKRKSRDRDASLKRRLNSPRSRGRGDQGSRRSRLEDEFVRVNGATRRSTRWTEFSDWPICSMGFGRRCATFSDGLSLLPSLQTDSRLALEREQVGSQYLNRRARALADVREARHAGDHRIPGSGLSYSTTIPHHKTAPDGQGEAMPCDARQRIAEGNAVRGIFWLALIAALALVRRAAESAVSGNRGLDVGNFPTALDHDRLRI